MSEDQLAKRRAFLEAGSSAGWRRDRAHEENFEAGFSLMPEAFVESGTRGCGLLRAAYHVLPDLVELERHSGDDRQGLRVVCARDFDTVLRASIH